MRRAGRCARKTESDTSRPSRGSRRLNGAHGQERGFADKSTSPRQTGPSDRLRSITAFRLGRATARRPGVPAGVDQARPSHPPFGRGSRCRLAAHGCGGLTRKMPGMVLTGWDRRTNCRWIAARPTRRVRISDARNADPCSIMNHGLRSAGKAGCSVRIRGGRWPKAREAMSRSTLWRR